MRISQEQVEELLRGAPPRFLYPETTGMRYEEYMSRHAIRMLNIEYPIEVITDPGHPLLPQVAAIDEEVFVEGENYPLSMFQEGVSRRSMVVFCHTTDNGRRAITDASLTVQPFEHKHASPLERRLDAFGMATMLSGTAIPKKWRGRGMHGELTQAREIWSLYAEACPVQIGQVRYENTPSYCSLTEGRPQIYPPDAYGELGGSGYAAIGRLANVYGVGPQNGRLVIFKHRLTGHLSQTILREQVRFGRDVCILPYDKDPSSLSNRTKQVLIPIPVSPDDEAYSLFERSVDELFDLGPGYIGLGHVALEGESQPKDQTYLRMVSIGALPLRLATYVNECRQNLSAMPRPDLID